MLAGMTLTFREPWLREKTTGKSQVNNLLLFLCLNYIFIETCSAVLFPHKDPDGKQIIFWSWEVFDLISLSILVL